MELPNYGEEFFPIERDPPPNNQDETFEQSQFNLLMDGRDSALNPGRRLDPSQEQREESARDAQRPQKSHNLKLNLTKLEKCKIVVYNLIEPVLLGSMIALALLSVQITSTYFLILTLFCKCPMLLTDNLSRIKIKKILISTTLLVGPAGLLMKFWIYYQFTPCTNFYKSEWLLSLFGIFPGCFTHTFVCDMIFIPASVLLVWHYNSQIKQQAEIEKQTMTSLKYQDELKFRHFVFGEAYSYLLISSLVFYFWDCLIYLSIVQLIILIALMITLYGWAKFGTRYQQVGDKALRVVQIIIYAFLSLAYGFRYANYVAGYQPKWTYVFTIFGFQTESHSQFDNFRLIEHRTVLSFALVLSETYFVARSVYCSFITTVNRQINRVGARNNDAEHNDLKFKEQEKSFTYTDFFSSLQISIVLWFCRILSFLVVYLYHDWQALVFLTWLLYSTFFRDQAKFDRLTMQVFFPLMILTYLFMFTVNIFGLINYSNPYGKGTPWSNTTYANFTPQELQNNTTLILKPPFTSQVVISKEVNMYRYGFYGFQRQHIEVTFYLIVLCVIAYYLKLSRSKSRIKEPSMLILSKLNPLLYDWVTVAIIKSEIAIMAYIIIFSLSVMDVFHNFILFWYIWGVLYPRKMTTTVLYVSYYAAFFLLIKYIYTLVPQFDGNTAECFIYQQYYLCTTTERIMFTFGFDSQYVPFESRWYFRYEPPTWDWVFVLAAFFQLRRQQILGTDLDKVNEEADRAKISIQTKFPRLYQLYVFYNSIFYSLIISASFVGSILIIVFLENQVINLISFLLNLVMLFIYLVRGTKTLLYYFKIIPCWYAFVLVSLTVTQFVCLNLSIYPSVFYWIKNMNQQTRLLFWLVGYFYYNDNTALWFKFAPVSFLFFSSVYIYSCIQAKYQYEVDELRLPAEPKSPHGINSSFQLDESPESAAEKAAELKRYEHEVENVYFKMKYQDSYKFWKMKILWPLFTQISLYYDVMMNAAILGFALYYSISAIWLVFLGIYAVQIFLIQRVHRSYRKKIIEKFKGGNSSNPLLVDLFDHNTENRALSYAISIEEARQQKVRQLVQKQQDDRAREQREEEKQNQEENKQEQTQNKEQDTYAAQKRRVFRLENRVIKKIWSFMKRLPLGPKRLILTDEQVHQEYTTYKEDIHSVSIQLRMRVWKSYYLILLCGFALSYFSIFIYLPDTTQVITPSQQSKAIFWFYFLGAFRQTNKIYLLTDRQEFFDQQYPFFILLVLLISEKIAQNWLLDKCSTTDEKIEHYKLIEETYKKWCKKEQQKVIDNPVQVTDVEQRYSQNRVNFSLNTSVGDFDAPALHNSEPLNKKQAQMELDDLLAIKNKIRFDSAGRIVLEELIVFLCLLSLIYRQNMFSFLIYFVVIFYTLLRDKSRNALSFCKYVILGVFFFQYLLAVLNMSSYNTQAWPTQLLNGTVYPNSQFYYSNIPNFFNHPKNTTLVGNENLTLVNLQTLSYYGINLQAQPLNVLWLDFLTTVLIYFYLNNFNCWIVSLPHKIVPSERTQYLIMKSQNDRRSQQYNENWKEYYRELRGETRFNKFLVGASEIIYMNFGLLQVTFLLLINVFERNLLTVFYLMFAVALIFYSLAFFRDITRHAQYTRILKLLLAYLLLDIGLQICANLPTQSSSTQSWLVNNLGLNIVWSYYPKNIYFGQNVTVSVTLTNQIGALLLKAIAYFLISVQLWILKSNQFMKFYNTILLQNIENKNKIGKGMAYRFNNFKNKLIMKQAKNYETLEYMLKHVKTLIKRRDKLYKAQQQQVVVQYSSRTSEKDDTPPELFTDADEIEIIEDQNEQKFVIDFATEFKQEVKLQYEQKLKKLSVLHKVYLWLRRNYVQDILFRTSEAHLDDMVQQFEKGRTCINSTLEIGLMEETKQEWLAARQVELEAKLEVGDINQEIFNDFKRFRDLTLEQSVLRPWERYDPENFLTSSKLFVDYLVLITKIISSHASTLVCYFFMLFAVIQNGGLLYMVYPGLVFGIALLEEDKPGKKFWYFTLFYSCFLLMVQILAQLSFFQDLFVISTSQTVYDELNKYNIGIYHIPSEDYNNFWSMVWWFTPEIGIIISILVLIQKETLANIFDVPLHKYESFEQGLDRQARLLQKQREAGYDQFLGQETTREGLLFDLSLTKKKSKTLFDIAELEEYAQYRKEVFEQINSGNNPKYESLESQIAGSPLDVVVTRKRSNSVIVYTQQQAQKKKNVIEQAKNFVIKWTSKLLFNQYFDNLFPEIKQQKPGFDYYVGIAAFSIIICFYLVLFYNQMTAIQTTLSDEIATTQFKGQLVIALMVMIGITVVDRILYSTYAFTSRQAIAERLNTDAPLMQNDPTSSDGRSQTSDELIQRRTTVVNQDSQLPIQRRTTFTDQDPQPAIKRRTTFSNQDQQPDSLQPQVTDQEQSVVTEREKRAFHDILTPQRRHRQPSTVFRYYFLWILLVLVHWYIFFALASDKKACKGETLIYCNRLTNNSYLMAFYVLFIFYFYFQAMQIQKGLPELRKGGFMLSQYNMIGQYTFGAWYLIPFLFELRTIIDWTFTQTSLDVFQSIKLAQVQSAMFYSLCDNKTYMSRQLGMKQPLIKKVAVGLSLIFLILVCIAGPMLLFSTLNPVATPNPVIGGGLQFSILIKDTGGTSTDIPIYSTIQMIQNTTLSQTSFDALNFTNIDYNTDEYEPSQSQAIQFSSVSDTVWAISPPKRFFLNQALLDARDGINPNQTVTAQLLTNFYRPGEASKPVTFEVQYPLNSSTPDILDPLITQTGTCAAANDVVTTFPSYLIQITLGLDASPKVQYVTPTFGQANYDGGYYQAGFQLTFKCFENATSESYWNLTQIYNSANSTTTQGQNVSSQENLIFNQTGGSVGFGFFVFNQNVLPNYLASYASSVLIFYATIIYLVASEFREGFVPFSYEIFIIDAPYTQDILMICQCIYIYRVQRSHQNEEELYHILIDIMRSPEMVKSLCGSSLKKKLD